MACSNHFTSWVENPMNFLLEKSRLHHAQFQNDGGCTQRFTPYCANSGFFYFVRYFRFNLVTKPIDQIIPAFITENIVYILGKSRD